MSKFLTPNQILGERGEAAARHRFLSIGFQFDGRSRLEAGIDGIAEVMDNGKPLGKMIAVQVKAKSQGRYNSETETSFTYTLRSEDFEYWSGSNLPVIIVLYRESDDTFYWHEVQRGVFAEERHLTFDKTRDILNRAAVNRLAALTVPKNGFGYYVPPLGEGEEALVNILPVIFPQETFVATTPFNGKKASTILLDADGSARFDWVIRSGTFWSFINPSETICRHIVDLDQVEAIETSCLAFHDDIDEQNHFSFLLRKALQHQLRQDLSWNKDRKLFYFRAFDKNKARTFAYEGAQKRTSAEVVNVSFSKDDPKRVDFVRHHAFEARFEIMGNQWYLVINPTYFFTTNGFTPHTYPAALLAGKKRLDNSASVRGQVIMWHRLLTRSQDEPDALFAADRDPDHVLKFGEPPKIQLATRVPEDVWGSPKKQAEQIDGQTRMVI
jgi:hypothetical protein